MTFPIGYPPCYWRGYHATERASADNILKWGWVESARQWDWLGAGVYFYADAPHFAQFWAQQQRRAGLIDHPVVLAADISVRNVLDIADLEWGEELRRFYEVMEGHDDPGLREAAAAQLPFVAEDVQPRRHDLDCFIIDHFIEIYNAAAPKQQALSLVRGLFPEGGPLYPKAHLFSREHIQIAVRDITLISAPWEVDV